MDNQSKFQATEKSPRGEYTAPQLMRWGEVSDLTQLGKSGGPGDGMFDAPYGSVTHTPHG